MLDTEYEYVEFCFVGTKPNRTELKEMTQAECSQARQAPRDHTSRLQSEPLIAVFGSVAEAGPHERSHLLRVGALGALMSMFLGDDSPYPELVRNLRPRRRALGGGGDDPSVASPRRTYRSIASFSPASSSADPVGEEEEDARPDAARGLYGIARDHRQVCLCVKYVNIWFT